MLKCKELKVVEVIPSLKNLLDNILGISSIKHDNDFVINTHVKGDDCDQSIESQKDERIDKYEFEVCFLLID